MSRKYLKYIIFIIFLFFLGLILWPTVRVKFDISTFHYDKIWKGPNLSDVFGESVNKNFDIHLGSDFQPSSEYILKMLPNENPVDEAMSIKTAEIVSKRLIDAGVEDFDIKLERIESDYFINLKVPFTIEEFKPYNNIFLEKGVSELWVQNPSKTENPEAQIDSLKSYFAQTYDNTGFDFDKIIGAKVSKEEDTYFLRVGLSTEQGNNLRDQLITAGTNNYILFLGEEFFYIDLEDISLQFQQYGSIRALKLINVYDEISGNVSASILVSENLPSIMYIDSSRDISAPVINQNLQNFLLLISALTIIISILLILIFKKNGLSSGLSIIFYYFLLLASLKIFEINLSIWVMVLLTSFYGLLISGLIYKLILNKRNENIILTSDNIIDQKTSQQIEKILLLFVFAYGLIVFFSVTLLSDLVFSSLLSMFLIYVIIRFVFQFLTKIDGK